MENGDLSSQVAPSVMIVFEGAVGVLRDAELYDKHVKRKRFSRALWDCFTPHDLVVKKLLWLYHRRNINIEVVTYLPSGVSYELPYWLQKYLPVLSVIGTTPESMGRQITFMDHVPVIYDPVPERWLMYGKKGRVLEDANQIGEGL